MEELNLLCEALSKSHTDTTYFNATNGLTFADFEWTDNPITESQFNAVVTSVATNAYARSRKAAYDLLNQDEMRYDDLINSTTTWQDAIAAIKTEYPK
tara:strand:+ start:483 stop:776 length:294 start_codon:yes stop_codon:yes gene_type:complete